MIFFKRIKCKLIGEDAEIHNCSPEMLFRHNLPSFPYFQPVSGLREVPSFPKSVVQSQGRVISTLRELAPCSPSTQLMPALGACWIFSGPNRMIFNMLFITPSQEATGLRTLQRKLWFFAASGLNSSPAGS